METDVGTVSEITHKDGGTLSAFLTNLAVLKNFGAENTGGVTETTYTFGINGLTKDETIETNVASTLNQSNIDYFRNLYTNMNTVYIHLQNLLFIVVGGFFLATLGGGKIQKYLENRGQSTGNKEPYLHKFFIPLLCAGVFYMPITSGGGVNSTMIQKIIQYFSIEANNIADKASSIGANIYMNKVYASTKINNSDDVVAGYEAKVEEQKNINAIAKKYMAYCEKRWANLKISGSKNAQSLDEVLALANFEELTARADESQLDTIEELKQELNMIQKFDVVDGGMDSIEQDITLQACAKAKAMRDSYAQE